MKPHARQENEALYKQRRFKTFGDIFTYDPTSRFLFRKGWRNGVKKSNLPSVYRPTKARRTEGRFLKLRAFKLVHKLS